MPTDPQTALIAPRAPRAPAPDFGRPAIDGEMDTAGAWARWFARSFDVWWQTGLVALVAGLLLCRTSPAFLRWLETPFGWKLFGLLCIPAGLLLDALLQNLAGNTPGKAMLGLRLRTLDGRKPGLRELVRRNLSLWRAGLALGLPVLSLLTMARQGLRLRKGLAASYDGVYFRVDARPVAWWRKAVFGLLFVLLFGAVVVLDAMDRQDSREMAAVLAAPPYGWTNPVTGRTVRVAPQWSYEAQEDEDGMRVHMFTQHSEHAVLVFAQGDYGELTLAQYGRALAEALDEQVLLAGGRVEDFRGKPSWVGSGENREGGARVQLRVVEVNGRAWRVMVMQSPPVGYTDKLVQELAGALWDSVVPRPSRPGEGPPAQP